MPQSYHSGKRIQSIPNEYKVHEFTSSGTLAVTGSGDIEYLVVAGGGGGYCGGGGAGGMRTGTLSVSAGNKTVTVGAGGYSGQCNVNGHGNNGVGGNSVFDSITSTGGGFGGGGGAANNTAGGSSGGAGGNYTSNGGYPQDSVTPNQGNNGGASDGNNSQRAGAGGGAGSVGGNATAGVAVGGDGLASSISGSSVIYAGGGGGGFANSSSGTGGQGGSGGGGSDGAAGTTNLGAGGGGHDNSARAGYGGSGIVIVRYLTSSGITATGGTITTANAHDARPLNVQAGSRLEETDTRKMYYSVDPLVFDENYSSSPNGWALDSTFTISGGVLNNTNCGAGTLKQATKALGVTIGSTFIFRFGYKPESSTSNLYPLAITNGTTQINSNSVGYGIKADGAGNLTLFGCTGSSSLTQSTYNTSLSVSTQYYIEITNDNSNVSMKIFTGSDYTSQVGSTVSITDKNFTTINTIQSCGRTDGSDSNNMSWEIDDVKIYNNVTSIGNVWSELGT